MKVLMFNMLDTGTSVQDLELYACIRDKSGAVIDLRRVSVPEKGTVDGQLLPSFVAGYRLFKK